MFTMQNWQREAMHGHLQRQLHRVFAVAAIMVLSAAAVAVEEPTPSVADELAKVRAQEAELLARSAPPEEIARLSRTYEELARRFPKEAAVRLAAGEFLWTVEHHAEAVRWWQQAELLEPANATVLGHLGGAALAKGEVKRAFDYLTRATAAAPANAEFHFDLANVAFMFRQELPGAEAACFQLARHHFAEATRLAPLSAEYARAYAELFYTLPEPDWDAALAAWRKFAGLTDNKDFALVNLARVHMKRAEKTEARACLEQVRGAGFDRLKKRLLQRMDTE